MTPVEVLTGSVAVAVYFIGLVTGYIIGRHDHG